MIDLCVTELAWAAGFFDGEGTFNVHRPSGPNRNNLGCQVTLPQINREPLDRFAAAVGVGKVFGPYDRKVSPLYIYKVYGFEDVQHITSLLWPWLCSPKREQAFEGLSRYLASYKPPPKASHGTRHMYKVLGCRCEPCIEVNRAYQREWGRNRKRTAS